MTKEARLTEPGRGAGAAGNAAPAEPLRIPLSIVPPFSDRHLFDRARQTGTRARLMRLYPERRRFVRAVRAASGRALPVAVQFSGDAEAPAAEAIFPAGTSAEDAASIVPRIKHMIGAACGLGPFYDAFAEDAVFAPLLEKLRGAKILLDPDPFECLVKTIIQQQLNMAFAGVLIERLAALCGETVEYGGETLAVFPGAEAVARLRYDDLRALSFSQRKAEYVIDAARAAAGGRLDFARIERMDDAEAIQYCTQFRGIGRWTAECFLIFGYGRPDLLPAADIGLRNAIRAAYGLGAQPSAAEVDAIGAAWAPWRTYASFYLWESLRLA